jgi:phosphatidylinositol alpha-1,6-mannosyltransferase
MGSVAAALGPDRVCCLTGTPAKYGAVPEKLRPFVYRRPLAFAQSNFVQALGWATAIGEIMARERPKVVQLADVGDSSLGLWLKRWLGLPYVVYAHGNEVLAAQRSTWDKPRTASRFTGDLVRRMGVCADRIVTLNPGCDVELFRPSPPDLTLKKQLLRDRVGDRVIMTVGGLVPRKGYDTVIRALPRVLRSCPDVTYLIVTSDRRNYDTELDALARAVGVRDRVVFAYDVPTAELPRVYALSDIFVMPSRADEAACDVEGFGLVFIEANACGKPVIGGRSGGISDAVVDGKTGVLVDPGDTDGLAAAIVELLEDPELARRMGEQGRQRAIAEFDWSVVAEKLWAVLTSVVRNEARFVCG